MNPQIVLLLNAMPTGRVFGLDQQTLIQIGIQLVNISFLAFVLSRVLYNPVRNFMQKRTEKIQSQLSGAESDMAKAKELKLQYETKLANIELERSGVLDAARRVASDKSKQILDEAKAEAEAAKSRALHEIQMEQERVKDEIKQSIIEVSSAMTAKFIARSIDGETHEKLFEETIAELKELKLNDDDTEEPEEILCQN